MENLTKDMSIVLWNGRKIDVYYDDEKECNYIIKDNIAIIISDLKNMLSDTLVKIISDIYDVKYIDFINEVMLERYYDEICNCIDSDYYMEDMCILKDLFDEYMISNNKWL